jgi:hypothetical protein
MESLRLDLVPGRVAAWHHRSLLARRITPAQVSSAGWVLLPFAQRAGRATLRRGFDEDFLDGASLSRIARWAARHGAVVTEPPAGAPLRTLAISGRRFAPEDTLVTVAVRTALVDDGWQRTRVLLGAGDRPAVFGRRLPGRARHRAAGAMSTAAIVVALLPWAPTPADWLATPAEARSAEPVAATPSAAAPEPLAPAHPSGADGPPAAPASPPRRSPRAAAAPDAPASAAGAPLDVEPRLGRIDLPTLKPALGPVQRAERPPPKAPPPVWALATRPLRSEAESEQLTVTMAALLQRAGLREVRVRVLEVGGDFHVVGWPFATRGAAENARTLLASRGLKTEAVEF